MQDKYFKKELKYKFDEDYLYFDAGETLFSTYQIDHGSDALIRYVKFSNPKEILDIGCGYGVIGISLATKFPESNITAVDRDLLAVKYSNNNASKNNIKNFTAIGSIGIETIHGKKFDLIVSNIPAKIGDKAIEQDFIFGPLSLLNEGGEYWVVIVNALNRNFIKPVNREFYSLELMKKRSGHLVYKLKPKKKLK